MFVASLKQTEVNSLAVCSEVMTADAQLAEIKQSKQKKSSPWMVRAHEPTLRAFVRASGNNKKKKL